MNRRSLLLGLVAMPAVIRTPGLLMPLGRTYSELDVLPGALWVGAESQKAHFWDGFRWQPYEGPVSPAPPDVRLRSQADADQDVYARSRLYLGVNPPSLETMQKDRRDERWGILRSGSLPYVRDVAA